MFLVRYKKYSFIDAERIDQIQFADGKIQFHLAPNGDRFIVEDYCAEEFINNIQAINHNFNIEQEFLEYKKERKNVR